MTASAQHNAHTIQARASHKSLESSRKPRWWLHARSLVQVDPIYTYVSQCSVLFVLSRAINCGSMSVCRKRAYHFVPAGGRNILYKFPLIFFPKSRSKGTPCPVVHPSSLLLQPPVKERGQEGSVLIHDFLPSVKRVRKRKRKKDRTFLLLKKQEKLPASVWVSSLRKQRNTRKSSRKSKSVVLAAVPP